MDKQLIIKAIESAINLLWNELDAISNDYLKNEFEITLEELNRALIEIEEA